MFERATNSNELQIKTSIDNVLFFPSPYSFMSIRSEQGLFKLQFIGSVNTSKHKKNKLEG